MDQHYYTENPASEIKEKSFSQTINGINLSFVSVSGVFSFETKIDKASDLLIKHFVPSGGSVLDMGCGYGAIGLYIKALHPDQSVWMADINNRAVEYVKINALKNKLEVNVLNSNLYSGLAGMKFDDIVTNPPIAVGKKLNIQLINEAPDYLNPGGALWLVAFHNKGGSTLKDIMKVRFENVEDIEKSGGMRVYRSVMDDQKIRNK
ncbi:MAG: class I SAM-dependent methyltransferase [Ruminiclostridium sp.]|nr:class I SAM-dependent methyltransferase [Ruminiclostridium sp.]